MGDRAPLKSVLVWWVLLSAATCALAFGAFPGEFAYDEYPVAVRNPCVQGTAPLSEAWVRDLWCRPPESTTGSYRPLAVVWARMMVMAGGGQARPFVFRIGSAMLFGGVAALFGLLLWRLGLSLPWRALGVLCFLFQGIHVESYLSAAAISDLLAALFLLGFLLVWLPMARRRDEAPPAGAGSASLWWSSPLFIGALMSKEYGVLAFPAVFLLLWLRREGDASCSRSESALVMTLLMTTLVYLAWRTWLFSALTPVVSSLDNPLSAISSLWLRTLAAVSALGKGLTLSLLPVGLSIEHGGCTDGAAYLAAGAAVLIASLAGAWMAARRRSLIAAAALLLFWLPLGVASNLVALTPSVLAERHWVLPGGAAILVGIVGLRSLYRWRDLHPGSAIPRHAVPLLAGALFLTQLAGTVLRVPDWRSEEQLYHSANITCPQSYKMAVNYGNLLRQEGRCHEATEIFLTAAPLTPPGHSDPSLLRSLGMAAHLCGDFEAAIRHYEQSLAATPDDPATRDLLAEARQGRIPREALRNLPY